MKRCTVPPIPGPADAPCGLQDGHKGSCKPSYECVAVQPLQVSAEQLATILRKVFHEHESRRFEEHAAPKYLIKWHTFVKMAEAALAATPPQRELNDFQRASEAALPLVGRWIPVSEKLPEIGTWNAIALSGGMVVADFRGGLPYSKYVTHWQPLPSPPGAEASLAVEPQPEDNK